MITNATKEELEKALEQVNKKYKNNIMFKNLTQISKSRIRFTLTVKDSRGTGSRIGITGRRIKAACWHVHGDFFDELFKINNKIWVKTGIVGQITSREGNWLDYEVGRKFNGNTIVPVYYSQLCNCEEE